MSGDQVTPKQVIQFYSKGTDYGYFSNFSAHHINLKNKKWPTVEHYFQAQKFVGTDYEEEIRITDDNPATSKKMGNTRKYPLRADWEQVKEQVMKDALYAKFTQHRDLKKALLDTGDAILVEHTKNDTYWGDGGDGTGKNRLGACLEEIRARIRAESAPAPAAGAAHAAAADTPLEAEIPKNENRSVSTGTSSSEEEGEGSSEDESSTGGAKPKRVRRGKTKGQRQRSVFKDIDGSAIMEKSSSGAVRVVGSNIEISSKAITGPAKVVVHQNQWDKKRKQRETGVEDMDEDDDSYMRDDGAIDEEARQYIKPRAARAKKTTLGQFLPPTSQSRPAQGGTSATINVQPVSVILETVDNTVAVLAGLEDSAMRAELQETLKSCHSHLSHRIQTISDEATITSVLERIEKLNSLLA